MKKILLLILTIFACCLQICLADNGGENPSSVHLNYWLDMAEKLSGEEYMQAYTASMDSLDITVNAPAGFVQKDVPTIFFPSTEFVSWEGSFGASFLGPAFESESKDALIVYPLAIDYIPQCLSPDGLVQGELICATGNESLDITNMIKVVYETGNVNADWIIEYEYDLADSKWEGPRHCVGLAIRKKNHFAFPIKIFLTDEGLKHKDEYVALALSCVKYGDQPKPEWIELEKNVRADELTFPLKHPKGGGLIVD